MTHDTLDSRDFHLGINGIWVRITTWATTRTDWRGQTKIGYRLATTTGPGTEETETIFEGEDFSGSPLHADDSRETMGALLGFLTLRPGDTDPEYFEAYTPRQLEFVYEHGEDLGLWACELEEGETA